MGKGIGRIGSLLVDDLNSLKDGLGTKFAHEMNSRFDRVSARLQSQTGRAGPISIAKQKDSGGTGLHLNDQRLAGVAVPKADSDLINLKTLRRFKSCDWFLQMAEDCLELPETRIQAILPGSAAWVFSNVQAAEVYTYPDSDFVLLHTLARPFPIPAYTLAVIEMPELSAGAPVTIRGTFTAPFISQALGPMMVDEPRGVVYGVSGMDIVGAFGHPRAATFFNTYDISNVDSLTLVQSTQVLWLDGPPGASGITVGTVTGATSYRNKKALVFQSGTGEIITDSGVRIAFLKVDIPTPDAVVTALYAFDDYHLSSGPAVQVAIGDGDIAYVVADSGDDPGVASAYVLVTLNIAGNASVPPILLNKQVIDTGVPTSPNTTLRMQVSGTKLHILHEKWANPPSVALQTYWKVYDLANPTEPVLVSNKVSPCNRWIGMHVSGDCVMLTERFAGAATRQTATLWSVSDPANPRLRGGCLQHETPGTQQTQTHFLRDSRGYYLTGIGGRLVIEDFIGHGVTC